MANTLPVLMEMPSSRLRHTSAFLAFAVVLPACTANCDEAATSGLRDKVQQTINVLSSFIASEILMQLTYICGVPLLTGASPYRQTNLAGIRQAKANKPQGAATPAFDRCEFLGGHLWSQPS